MDNKKLWVAGNLWGDIRIIGVFDTEAAAVAVCDGKNDFVGPVVLNQPIPESEYWKGSYIPIKLKRILK